VRLCLDEHYSPRIAATLRERGHDVIAAGADAALRGQSDEELLAFCVREQRALLTENVADFMRLAHERASRGDAHSGLVFSSPSSMPRGSATIGQFVEALDELLRERPGDDGLRDEVRWLEPPQRP
jgi:hypothetical protein